MAKNYHYIELNNRECELLLKLRKEGKSFYYIANQFGMTTESIKQQWRKIKPRKTSTQLYRQFDYKI